jgi:hypothetical protein|tara:strand:- start:4740 stop:5162 length:423 start_codon:yes stop_codon:yes gene_type:complete
MYSMDDNSWDGMTITVMTPNLINKFISIPGKTWEEKLMSCINCECCPRHMINRPTELKPWIELHWSREYDTNRCVCPCRHNARFICRQVEEPALLCPQGSPRDVDDFTTVLTPTERNAWLDRVSIQEMEDAMEVLTTSES